MATRLIFPFAGGAALGRGDPFVDLHREMNRLFEDASRGTRSGRDQAGGPVLGAPRMDIHESETGLEITAELPGVSQDDVDLRLEGDVLTVRGEKRYEHQDKHAHVVERAYGTFQRSIQLPFSPDPEQVEANFENGVLAITLPKTRQQEKAHKVEIRGAKTSQKNIEGSVAQQAEKESTHPKSSPKK